MFSPKKRTLAFFFFLLNTKIFFRKNIYIKSCNQECLKTLPACSHECRHICHSGACAAGTYPFSLIPFFIFYFTYLILCTACAKIVTIKCPCERIRTVLTLLYKYKITNHYFLFFFFFFFFFFCCFIWDFRKSLVMKRRQCARLDT
jgi:hypothetical protein